MSVRVRMAPSPTGFIHIGNLRTCIYDDLFAKHHGGTLVLRIEDTDQKRFVEGATEAFCRTLKAMNIIPDEGMWIDDDGKMIERGPYAPYLQTKRTDIHQKRALELIEKDKAYYCFCTEERLDQMRKDQQAAGLPTRYDKLCRALSKEDAAAKVAKGDKHVIRLKLPDRGDVSFHDEIRGDITFDWKEMDDQIIIKEDGIATYHLAATSDDHDMEITHVIRGEEWLSSTPKHLFIYQCFDWTPPSFAHVPLLLNADRTKLSKRQGDVSVESYLEKGFLPETLYNFVALLGWNPSDSQEIYRREELVKAFDLSKVNKSGAVVNFEKLLWLNAQYVKKMSDQDFQNYVHPVIRHVTEDEELVKRIASVIRERMNVCGDADPLAREFLDDSFDPDLKVLCWKEQTKEDALEKLHAMRELLVLVKPDHWTVTSLDERIKQEIVARGWKNGEVLWPLRVALSGKKQSPPPFDLLYVLGEKESLRRIDQSIQRLTA